MRKILIGGLGVAGLLATVLALASSPATSQSVVVFTTDTEPGTYTVSWSTSGGCDPSRPGGDTTLATDGATGSASRTVAVPAGTAGTASVADAITGAAVEFSVSTASHCNYNWTASFTSNLGGSDGVRCLVNVVDATTAPATRDGSITTLVNAGLVADPQDTTFTLFVIEEPDTGTTPETPRCNVVHEIDVDIDRPTTTDNDGDTVPLQPHSGAILNTEFTVGAQQHTANNAPTNDECATVAEQTEVDDGANPLSTDDDTVGATITVVRTPLSDAGHTCVYNLGVQLPDGFDTLPDNRNSNATRVTSYALQLDSPTVDFQGPNTAVPPAADGTTVTIATITPAQISTACAESVLFVEGETDGTFDVSVAPVCSSAADFTAEVRVAERKMYVLQNVVGDSGGANARYSLTLNSACAIPHDLPQNLVGQEVGGIQTTDSVTVVELREGFFNISAAVMGRATTDEDAYGRTFAPRFALNADGDPCSFTAEVSHLPGNCNAAEDSITANAVTGADSDGRVIITFDIGCNGGMDDGGMDDGDDDMSDDDMSDGDDDMSGGDMGDMDDGDDDMGDMAGPPEDVATG